MTKRELTGLWRSFTCMNSRHPFFFGITWGALALQALCLFLLLVTAHELGDPGWEVGAVFFPAFGWVGMMGGLAVIQGVVILNAFACRLRGKTWNEG